MYTIVAPSWEFETSGETPALFKAQKNVTKLNEVVDAATTGSVFSI